MTVNITWTLKSQYCLALDLDDEKDREIARAITGTNTVDPEALAFHLGNLPDFPKGKSAEVFIESSNDRTWLDHGDDVEIVEIES